MEINYFLDSQQMDFEKLITEIAAEDEGDNDDVSKTVTDDFALPSVDNVESYKKSLIESEDDDDIPDMIFDQ